MQGEAESKDDPSMDEDADVVAMFASSYEETREIHRQLSSAIPKVRSLMTSVGARPMTPASVQRLLTPVKPLVHIRGPSGSCYLTIKQLDQIA